MVYLSHNEDKNETTKVSAKFHDDTTTDSFCLRMFLWRMQNETARPLTEQDGAKQTSASSNTGSEKPSRLEDSHKHNVAEFHTDAMAELSKMGVPMTPNTIHKVRSKDGDGMWIWVNGDLARDAGNTLVIDQLTETRAGPPNQVTHDDELSVSGNDP
ncbi:MAG: hypothetical protein TREMPRED_001810 [Tremellales sp. Tagirdzhanova-0007]|nr:MAG: hypothetical protein TREMPRED_001810 [Tremellales sp. Tagirdzhanova-0007]